jgi:hypothetical protein
MPTQIVAAILADVFPALHQTVAVPCRPTRMILLAGIGVFPNAGRATRWCVVAVDRIVISRDRPPSPIVVVAAVGIITSVVVVAVAVVSIGSLTSAIAVDHPRIACAAGIAFRSPTVRRRGLLPRRLPINPHPALTRRRHVSRRDSPAVAL